MDALGPIDIVDEVADLRQRLVKILIVGQIDFFFLDRPNHAFGIAVLARLAHLGHTDRYTGGAQQLDVVWRGVLYPAMRSGTSVSRIIGLPALRRIDTQRGKATLSY